jgi:mannan endo-1,4-beta-mannosidase
MFVLLFNIGLLFVSVSAFSGNGVNLQPSYYNNGNVSIGWDLMRKYAQIKTVRIEIEPDKVSQGLDWIQQAHSKGYQVIATYHKYTVLGSDDANELKAAANWWVKNYASLSKSGAFTVNLMNEWGSHNQSPDSFASAYNSAISTLRSVYSGWVIIDIPGWGQETRTAAQASTKISDKSVILSAHLYPGAWNQAANHYVQSSDIDELHSTGRPCMVGEFGTHGSGSCNVANCVNRAKQLGWSVHAWAWNGDGGDMNMVTPTWSQNPYATSFSESTYFREVINYL